MELTKKHVGVLHSSFPEYFPRRRRVTFSLRILGVLAVLRMHIQSQNRMEPTFSLCSPDSSLKVVPSCHFDSILRLSRSPEAPVLAFAIFQALFGLDEGDL